MALFAIWHDTAAREAEQVHARLLADAPIVPQRRIALAIDTPAGRWHASIFACATNYYSADAQCWTDPAGGLCIIHGLIWRTGSAALLDAAAVGGWLSQPGMRLPPDVAGEYAVVRLHANGTLEGFGDPAGLHQIFHRADGVPVIANRARFVASIAGEPVPDAGAGLWLGTVGYRIGAASAWAGVHQLAKGAHFSADAAGGRIDTPALHLPDPRGYDHGGKILLTRGLAQATAAMRLAAPADGPFDLPITGGKDSRVVLAIALAAGLRDRLTLFTRGYAGHPDVVVGAMIAEQLGVPHRRDPPLGTDLPADMSPRAFLRLLATIAWQGDGGMGGWDNVSGRTTGRETLVSGHLGEVLKAYAKRSPEGALDPAAMVRLQAPFDPLDLVLPHARAGLIGQLAAEMDAARAAGAAEADLPDLFYWHNRVPNWLGGIRGIKAFERQPILPLGVPALMRLAFQMTAPERKMELAHFRLIEAAAPELIDIPFAHQSWHPGLGAPPIAPVLAPAGSALFGSWQWSLARIPAVRAALAALFAQTEIPLWEDVDRGALIAALHQRRFDYFDLISIMGFAVTAIHQAGLGLMQKLDGDTIGAAAIDRFADVQPPVLTGYLDAAHGAARIDHGALVVTGSGEILLTGWFYAPDWPGAAVAIEARVDGRVVAVAAADVHRPDLQSAGIGDGRHAFRLALDASSLADAATLTLAAPDREDGPIGGCLTIRLEASDRSDGQPV